MVGGASMVKPLDSWFLISIGFLIVGGFAIAGILSMYVFVSIVRGPKRY
jgi:hypothetical protein